MYYLYQDTTQSNDNVNFGTMYIPKIAIKNDNSFTRTKYKFAPKTSSWAHNFKNCVVHYELILIHNAYL